jgi:NAD(P)-dependent dehydrogenase (short-subunit alcohol dehydrogenase family)
MGVRDKVVLITGAARGIGQEFARSFAAAGAHIVAADIDDCSATLGLVEAQVAKDRAQYRSESRSTSGIRLPPRAWPARQFWHSDVSTR